MEQARVAMKGTGNWVGSDAHGLFRVQLLRSTRVGQSIKVEVEGVPAGCCTNRRTGGWSCPSSRRR